MNGIRTGLRNSRVCRFLFVVVFLYAALFYFFALFYFLGMLFIGSCVLLVDKFTLPESL